MNMILFTLKGLPNTMNTVLDALNGNKAYLAAVIGVLVACNHVYQFVPAEIEEAVLILAGSLGVVGIRHAVAKLDSPAKE